MIPERRADRLSGLTGSPTLRFEGDRLIKRQSPVQSRIERERTQLGAQIASDSGLFDVPEILSYDDGAGEVTFRYIDAAVTLREHLVSQTDESLMVRVGQALAAIHNSCGICCGSQVFWHGDYGVGNVLYSAERDTITIVDWANAKWTHEPFERSCGRAGYDLGGALVALFHYRPLGHMYIPGLETLGAAFLRGYAEARNSFSIGEEMSTISELIHQRRQYWISQRGVLKNLAYDFSLVRLRFFLYRIRSRLPQSV